MGPGVRWEGGPHTCSRGPIWAVEVIAVAEALEIHPALTPP